METRTTKEQSEKLVKSYCGSKINKKDVYATVFEQSREPAYFCNPTCLLTFCIDKLNEEIGMSKAVDLDQEEYEIREVGEVLMEHIMTLLDYSFGETCKDCFKELKEKVCE